MNRKEGIIVGTLLIATFITGVFAVPEQQLLNVFVSNFPQNEVRVVISKNFIAAANATFMSESIPVDVAQFRHARIMAEILFAGSGQVAGPGLEVFPAFPVSPPGTFSIAAPITTSGAAGTCEAGHCTFHTMTEAITIDTPSLLIHLSAHFIENIEFTMRIVIFLQRY